ALLTRAIKIDHHTHEPDDLAQVRGVLPAGHGRLRTKIQRAIRQSSAGQLEGGVKAQPIEIVGILVAAGDRQNASPQNLRQPVYKPFSKPIVTLHVSRQRWEDHVASWVCGVL